MSVPVKYSGFVYAQMAEPSSIEALSIFTMLQKKNIKKTRAMHPLFARGCSSTVLLSLCEKDMKLSEKNGSFILDAPFRKIVFSSTVEKSLLIFVRRSGFEDSFKCHMFVFSSSSQLKEFSQQLLFLTSRTSSLEKRVRCDSVASLNMLPDACSISTVSVSDSDGDESCDSSHLQDDRVPSPPRIAQHVASPKPSPKPSPKAVRTELPRAPVAEKQSLCTAPCGICQSAEGEGWIALKNCGHQFHLPCMTSWREGLHNLCPSCPNPISTGVFTLHYIGTCKLSAPPTTVSLPGLVADMAACSCSQEHIRMQVTPTRVNVVHHDGRAPESHLVSSVQNVEVVGSVLAIVFSDLHGDLSLQLYECAVASESARVLDNLKKSLALARQSSTRC